MNVEQLRQTLRNMIDEEADSIRDWSRQHEVNSAQVILFLNGQDPAPAVLRAMGYEEVKRERIYRKKRGT